MSEPKTIRVRCTACAIMVINGVACHETGCPEAWKDSRPECPWCGQTFRPAERWQRFCCDDCHISYST